MLDESETLSLLVSIPHRSWGWMLEMVATVDEVSKIRKFEHLYLQHFRKPATSDSFPLAEVKQKSQESRFKIN